MKLSDACKNGVKSAALPSNNSCTMQEFNAKFLLGGQTLHFPEAHLLILS